MTDVEPIALAAHIADGTERATAQVMLRAGGDDFALLLTVPTAPSAMTPLLPIFQGMASALAARAEARAMAKGRTISCRAGCGACCRQPVPVSPSEARALAALVDAMPESRRAVITARFAAARTKFAAAGTETLRTALDTRRQHALEAFFFGYFRLGIACPFLEAESCSIHADRPISCREFLVTSPAAACSAPTRETIDRVKVAGNMSQAVITVDHALEGKATVLLIDSLDFTAANPPPLPAQPGTALVEAVFAALSEQS